VATRVYLSNLAAPAAPAVDAAWESSASPFARAAAVLASISTDSLATVAGFTSTAGQDRCHRQFVSPQMAAGNVFNTGVTYKAYAQVLESAANDNCVSRLGVRIVSADGSTVRHTILAVADYSTATEFNTAIRNKAFANGDAGTGSYTTVAGDRLVIEFGHNDASGASISASSRWGSGGSTDLPENETDVATTTRPWFETSLNIVWGDADEVVRYVNTASTAGGDGTTNLTAGVNRAFATLSAALTSSAVAKSLSAVRERVRIQCEGTAADTTAAAFPSTCVTSTDCYVSIIGDAPSSIQYSTSHYRLESTANGGVINCQYPRHVRFSRLQIKHTIAAGAGGIATVYLEGANGTDVCDYRADRVHVWGIVDNGRTAVAGGLPYHGPNVAGHRYVLTNCLVRGYKGTGQSHTGYALDRASATLLAYNCVAYDCGRGFVGAAGTVAKNCGASACDDGYEGTFSASSTNNASSLAADAPGSNARNSVTPTFVDAAGGNFHLASGDAAWKDFGTDLSADGAFPFSTDGDGETRTGTWDIGADEYVVTTIPQGAAGTITPSGALAKLTAKTTSGALSPVGAVVRRVAVAPGAAMTPSGSLSASKVSFPTVSGSVATVGALGRAAQYARTVSGVLAPAGALVRTTAKTTAGSLASSSTLSPRVGLKILLAGLTPSGAVTPSALKTATVGGAIVPSGSLVRLTGVVLAGSLGPSGSLSRSGLKVLSGALSPSGTVAPRVGLKILVGVLAPSGAIVPFALKAQALSGTVAPSGALSRRAVLALVGSVTPGGTLSRSGLKALQGAIAPAGGLSVTRVSVLALAGSLAPAGTLSRHESKVLSAVLAPSGALSRRSTRTLASALGLAGQLSKLTALAVGGVLLPAGAVSTASVFGLTVGGVLAPTSLLSRDVAHALSGVLGFSGSVALFTGEEIVFVDVDAPVLEGMRWVAAVLEGQRWDVPVRDTFRYTMPVLDD
jgi:hypothetical protein